MAAGREELSDNLLMRALVPFRVIRSSFYIYAVF